MIIKMIERVETVVASIITAVGGGWIMHFINGRKTKNQLNKDEIDNLRSIIEEMRLQVNDLRCEIKELKLEIKRKDIAYSLAGKCDNHEHCPVIKELNK